MSTTSEKQKSALVTGANGYIGQAVAGAFVRAGYTTYGLIRSPKSTSKLQKQLITPIIGSAADPGAVLSAVNAHTSTLDVIVSTTEDWNDYVSHFNATVAMFRLLAEGSNDHGVRPLVLFTSGSKDYGRGDLDGSSDLQPQTEESPLRPPLILADRTNYAPKILHEDVFDAAVLRPTHVHGYSSSYLGQFFEWATQAEQSGKALYFRTDPNVILHSVHVDDCGDAYTALADHPDRAEVRGQCFNISAGVKYETLRDIGEALVRLYRIEQGLQFESIDAKFFEGADPLITFSQWVSSEKVSNLTGWKAQRSMFAEDIKRYKQEYDDALREQDEAVARARGMDWHGVAKTRAKEAGLETEE